MLKLKLTLKVNSSANLKMLKESTYVCMSCHKTQFNLVIDRKNVYLHIWTLHSGMLVYTTVYYLGIGPELLRVTIWIYVY